MTVEALIADLVDEPGALLPILHRIQEHLGHVPADAIPVVAQALNLSRAEVHGVMTFYHDFRAEKPGRRVIKICQAEACQAMGAAGLTRHAEAQLGVALHGTSTDGAYTLEPIYCLGNCALAPSMLVDNVLHGRVTCGRFDQVIATAGEPA